MILSAAVVWFLVGILCIILEIATLSFVLLFFGLSAILVSLFKYFGLQNLPLELLLFSLGGLLGLFLFRSKLRDLWGKRREMDIDKNQIIILSRDILPGEQTEIEYQGSPWTAFNEESFPLKKGDKVKITRTESIKLIVKKA